MRTETITYNVYKYNELSDDAKQKVKDWYLADDDRNYWFSDDLKYGLDYLFGNNHSLEVQYSLGYCQGDGLNIYGSVSVRDFIDYIQNRCNNKKCSGYLTKEEMDTILAYAEYTDGIELPINHRYCYCMADYADFADEWIDQLEYAEVENIDEELISKFNNLVKYAFKSLCKEYEEDGYKYFYEISDEELEETCEANEWEFTADGKLWL